MKRSLSIFIPALSVLGLLLPVVLAVLLTACDAGLVAESSGADDALGKAGVQSTELSVFQAAGPFGGGVLTPGDTFPPTRGSTSKLVRNDGWVQYNIHTTGLPAGAYTVWIVTINAPGNCATEPCGEADVFGNPAADATVFWSDGGVVQANGVGNFKARVRVGELPTGDGQIGWPGNGLLDPHGAEIHLIVKYHGPASDDPAVLYEQTHTLVGSCEEGANGYDYGPPFGVQCFDPQVAIHMP